MQEPGFVAQHLTVDVREGEPVTVEKVVALFTSRDRAIAEPGDAARGRVARLADGFDELLERHVAGLGPAVAALPHRPGRRRRPGGGPHPQPARVPPAPDGVGAHHRPGRRGAGPGAARRGLPGPHLLGRAVRLPVPEPALPRADPGAAALPLPAAARGPPGGPGGRATRGDVPLAERQRRPRGDPAAAPQPAARAAGCPTHSHRQRHVDVGRRLQRLAVLPGHRRPGVPRRLRAPRCCWRSPASGPASPPTTATATATRSAG